MVQNESTFRRIRKSNAFITLVVCTAIFSDSFIYDLIIPFIPQMLENRLHQPRDKVQIWTSTLLAVFGGSFAVGNVLAGFLIDHSPSAKFPFLLGMMTMIASSLMFFIGQHIAITVSARALQGVSASFVWVSGIAYLNLQIKSSDIGTAMGYVSVAMAAGELTGPLVGGVMYEKAGHFAVLGLVCGILAVDILLRVMLIDKEPGAKQPDDHNENGEERPLLDGEPHDESEMSHPKIEIKHINVLGFQVDRDLCASFCSASIIGTIRDAFESALAVFVSHRFNWSTSASGGVLFALLAPAVFAPVVGRYTTKHGPRWLSIVMFGITSVALVGLGFLTHPNTVMKTLFVVVVAIIGICLSTLTTVQTIAFSVAAKRRELEAKQAGRSASRGSAFGGFSMAWTVGMFVGPLAAEVFIDHVNWLAFCVFLSALCAAGAAVMASTWKEWVIPED